MATIEPSSNIKLLKGVPLDNTYTNTIAFSSASAQESYFSGKSIFPVDDSQYQRADKGTLKVKKSIDDLFGCNYLMFNNKSFENKWIYAFVNRVEYISNNATIIEYEIDVIQTWLFDFNVKGSYVERETPSSDTYGTNRQAEPYSFTNQCYTMNEIVPNVGSDFLVNDLYYAVAVTKNGEGEYPADARSFASVISGCPSALWVSIYATLDECLDRIKSATDSNNLVYVTTLPKALGEALLASVSSGFLRANTDVVTKYVVFNSSDVRNNYSNTEYAKCRQYPYQSLVVQWGEQVLEFAPEGFSGNPEFELSYSFSAAPTMVLHPVNYSDKTIYIEGTFPQIPWNDSLYAQITASNSAVKGDLVLSALQNPSIASIPATIGNYVLNGAKTDFQNAVSAPSAHGYANDNSALVSKRLFPKFYVKHLVNDCAKTLDAFFTYYGYSTNRVKAFTKTSAKNYKYVKTSKCTLTGNVPVDYLSKIVSIHNNGLTYWNSAENVANY